MHGRYIFGGTTELLGRISASTRALPFLERGTNPVCVLALLLDKCELGGGCAEPTSCCKALVLLLPLVVVVVVALKAFPKGEGRLRL